MNVELKSAWFTVGVAALSFICCILLAVLIGFPRAFGALGFFGLIGLSPLLYRKNGTIACDERDSAIAKKASLIAGVCSYQTFVLGSMGVWFFQFYRGERLISIHCLPALVCAAAVVLLLVRSTYIISQYTPNALGENE